MSGYVDQECTAPDVVTGTLCLPNTTGRCTWCGRPVARRGRHNPRPEPSLAEALYQSLIPRGQPWPTDDALGRLGTDPLEDVRGPDDD